MYSDIRKYLIFILLGTFLSAFSAASILVFSDPKNTSSVMFIFLFLSLFLFATGIFTLCGLIFRKIFPKGLFSANLSNSFRQGLLLAIFFIACLLLSIHGLLYWWVAVAVFAPIAAAEAFLNLKI